LLAVFGTKLNMLGDNQLCFSIKKSPLQSIILFFVVLV
jgi:hypothetical protein